MNNPCEYPTSNMRIVHQPHCPIEIHKWECHVDDVLFGYPCTCYATGGWIVDSAYIYYSSGCVMPIYGGGR